MIGEKAPENCSALFCYLDTVVEAYRVLGALSWLRYDEQFRQHKAVRPSLRWDHKDISLWNAADDLDADREFFFQSGAGGSSSSGQLANKGYCWLYNKGTFKFGKASI